MQAAAGFAFDGEAHDTGDAACASIGGEARVRVWSGGQWLQSLNAGRGRVVQAALLALAID